MAASKPLRSYIDPGLMVGNTEDGDEKPRLDLCNADFEAMEEEPYDPLWIYTYNIHPAILESFQSNQTLERLFNNNAIKIGDEIYLRGSSEVEGEAVIEKVAKVIGMNRETMKPYLVRPHVTIMKGGQVEKDLTCRSLQDILVAFNDLEIKESVEVVHCWRTLRLRRGLQELGSLHDVRQAWDLWKQVMILWRVSNRIKSRKSRSSGKKKADQEQVVSFEDDSGPANQQTVNPQTSDQSNQSVGSQAQDQLPPSVIQPMSLDSVMQSILQVLRSEPTDGTSSADQQSPIQSSGLPPPTSQTVPPPVSQPVFQPVHQTHEPEPTDGTYSYPYADKATQTESSAPPPPVFRSVYQIQKTFHGGRFVFPWEAEGRPMYPYEYESLRSGPEPHERRMKLVLSDRMVTPQEEGE